MEAARSLWLFPPELQPLSCNDHSHLTSNIDFLAVSREFFREIWHDSEIPRAKINAHGEAMGSKMTVLNQEIDRGTEPSYYRMLVDGKDNKYSTIDAGTYDCDTLCFPPDLLENLPNFPPGDWNSGRIGRDDRCTMPVIVKTLRAELPSIRPLWHPHGYDYLSFTMVERLTSNVSIASAPAFKKPMIIKYARFEWEIGYYARETGAYSWLQDQGIAPAFLGHLREGGRVMGVVLERVEGRHTEVEDLDICKHTVMRLHRLGIMHLSSYWWILRLRGGPRTKLLWRRNLKGSKSSS